MMNFLRNNTTGKTYEFQSAPGTVQNSLMLDYAQPIEIAGFGKGYRVKGDPYTVALNDGRTMQIGIDEEATAAKRKQALEMEKAQLSNKLLEAQITSTNQREQPNLQHVETPNGPMAFNPKTGGYQAIMSGGQPMQSKEQAQRASDANAVMELTDEAAPLIPKAPGSYGGAALNQLGRVFGMDTEASKAQAQMDVISGALVAKMPKMTGPQSDKDVLLYKQMAGNLNDPTVPTAAKQAAMKTLRMLNEKYATPQAGGMQQAGAAGDAIRQAQQAIAAGAPKDAVIRRLQQLGITDHGIQ